MTRLLYFTDPMCSWCWGFAGALEEVEPELQDGLSFDYVMGGLAPDDEEPMPEAIRRYVQNAWRAVEASTGARFDHSFWDHNVPRRSTWPACRAVIAAGDRGREMFGAIQRAYYLEARDPSDRFILAAIAGELGFDPDRFAKAIDDDGVRAQLDEGFALRDALGVTGYPSVALEREGRAEVVTRGWVDAASLRRALAAHGLLS